MKKRYLLAAFLLTANAAWAAGPSADPQLIKRGEYLSRAGDCIACHTAPEGRIFAGGRHVNAIWHVVYLQYHAGPGHRHR